MKMVIRTNVDGHYKNVFSRFDRGLFESLKPIGVALDVLRFDGCKKGDFVMLRITPPFTSQGVTWLSEITENETAQGRCFFVDEGRSLPWPLVQWRHRHIVQKIDKKSSLILDEIEYQTPYLWMDYCIFPVMYFTFYQRVFAYKKYFSVADKS